MNSRVVPIRISHERYKNKNHSFEYRLVVLILDLDELKSIDHSSRLFGLNRFSPFSIFDQDYLTIGPEAIRDKLKDLLKSRTSFSLSKEDKVFLLTSARVFGHVFNPISFYFIYSSSGKLLLTAAEVNNTFGDKHLYVLENQQNPQDFPVKHKTTKALHVSPFFEMSGEYSFSFSDIRKELDISIILSNNGSKALKARMWQLAAPKELKDFNLLRTWLFHPLAPNMTYPRIIRQAMSLYFLKGLPVFSRPEPSDPMTIRTMQQKTSLLDRIARKLVLANFKKIRRGRLEMQMPDNSVLVFQGNESGPTCRMVVHDPLFFRKLLKGEDVGLGEAYTRGMWTADNLTELLELLVMNMNYLSYLEDWGFWGRSLHKMIMPARKMIPDNDPEGSRKNVRAHYDLSNEFFSRFLDPGMTYSCAVFENPKAYKMDAKTPNDLELQKAQERKYTLVAEAAGIKAEQDVIEIGCGWGEFAIFAARNYGCRVHAVTISQKQHQYVEQRVKSQGLSNRINVILEDYRKLSGKYDALVSIEALEAVGHKYHPDFFRTVDRLLKPGGLACIQTITILDQRYDAYRKTRDWISTYIFPGGLLPSLSRITKVLARDTSLIVSGINDIGAHYGPTMAAWRRRFLENWEDISRLGFDDSFRRTWLYYFCLCEAAFNQRHIRDLQIVLDRPDYLRQNQAQS